MYDIQIKNISEIKCRIVTDPNILQNLREKYSFFADGYKYHPSYKKGVWDGRINMIDAKGVFPTGLLKDLLRFCKQKGLSIHIEDINKYLPDNNITDEYVNKLGSLVKFSPYDYQLKSVKVALKHKKQLILSPTGCLDATEVLKCYQNGNVVYLTALYLYQNKPKNIYIDTPNGKSHISEYYKKHSNGLKFTFSDNTTLVCSCDHLMTDDDLYFDWKSACEYKVGDYLYDKAISSIESVGERDWYDFTVENESQSYYHKGIIHHNSGKSCIAYMLFRHCLLKGIKMLITVPSTSLVEQLYEDFKDYVSDDLDVSKHVSKVYGGQDKENLNDIVISTWQTANTMSSDWFSEFGFYLCDEAHLAKAKSLTEIISNMPNCPYRIGMTGTLSGSDIHEIEMNARFGTIFKMVTTRELIDRGILTDIEITCNILKYSKEVCKEFHKIVSNNYQREIEYIIDLEARNNYLKSLTLGLSDTTLLLFNRVETHGIHLFDIIEKDAIKNNKRVYFISGKIKTVEREHIRNTIDSDLPKFYRLNIKDGSYIKFDEKDIDFNVLSSLVGKNISISDLPKDLKYYIFGNIDGELVDSISEEFGSYILLASYGTLAVGVNIKKLHNLVLCHPHKGKIINLQSIGRILRKSEVKNKVRLYDVIDDFRIGRRKDNHTYKHGTARIEIYEHEEFDYEIKEIQFGD